MKNQMLKKIMIGCIALFAAVLLVFLNANTAKAGGGPTINEGPHSQQWSVGQNAVYSVTCDGDTDHNYGYQWYLRYQDQEYDLMQDVSKYPWISYTGYGEGKAVSPVGGGSSFVISGIQEGLDGSWIYCVVTDEKGESSRTFDAYISVGQVPGLGEINAPTFYQTKVGESVELKADFVLFDISDGQDYMNMHYQWYNAPNGELFQIQAIMEEAASNKYYTITPTEAGTYCFICGCFYKDSNPNVKLEDKPENVSYTGTITVVVYPADETPVESESQTESESQAESESQTESQVESQTEVSESESAKEDDGENIKALSAILSSPILYVILGLFATLCILLVVLICVLSKKKK